MGLDMYLNKTVKADIEEFKRVLEIFYDDDTGLMIKDSDAIGSIIGEYHNFPIYVAGMELNGKRYVHTSLTKEVGYWRKANQIHRWFVQNVQGGVDDCEYYIVTKEQLESLFGLCKTAIAKNDTTLLPPQSGFFFGGTEIDEWYWKGIEQTLDVLLHVLEETDFETEMVMYMSSW